MYTKEGFDNWLLAEKNILNYFSKTLRELHGYSAESLLMVKGPAMH